MDIKTILVATDFSEHSAKALDTAISLAKRLGARVEVLHAFLAQPPIPTIEGGYVMPDDYFKELRQRAKDAVTDLVKRNSGCGVEISGRSIESPPSAAILEVAKKDGVDLIVMGTRGQTGLKHVLLGSVAERVVRNAHCPVMTVKGDD